MRKAFLGGMTAVVFIAGVGAANAAGRPALPSTLHSKTTNTPVAGAVTRVELHGDVGDLVVHAGGSPAVATHQQWNVLAPTVTETVNSGVLTVTTKCPNVIENNCSVDVTITVRPAVRVDATANVGDISTRGLVGPEALQTSVGDVDVTNVRAARLDVVTDTGSIAVNLPTAPIHTKLEAQVGDINATVPAGPYALTATAETGDVHVTGVTNNPAADRALVAQSQTGDVTVIGK